MLHSQTFARSDQLKSFLKYVCEMEMAGRGHELTEYLIEIEALGQPANYSPGDDSAVRTRAFALGKKPQEFYEQEQPDAARRIELQKGSYFPHFVEDQPHRKGNGNGTSAERLVPQLVPSPTAAEFFGSPEYLLEMKKELKKAGHDTFPPAYQVVVRAETDDSILRNFRYETYRIIPPSL